LLLFDFEKTFDKIEWGFRFLALSKLGFSPKWIKWVSSFYWLASSSIKVNGEFGEDFKLSRSVRQGCPLVPYLFILVVDVLGHMLDDTKYNVEGLTLPKGGCVRDQTFADDIAIYLKGTKSNMDKMRSILDLFCLTFGAKINWGKFVAIWANKKKLAWEWAQKERLKWVLENEGVRYLGIQVGFQFLVEANFDKLMISLKGKMIVWGNCNLFLAGRILITN
jgi:hypothetical protein